MVVSHNKCLNFPTETEIFIFQKSVKAFETTTPKRQIKEMRDVLRNYFLCYFN